MQLRQGSDPDTSLYYATLLSSWTDTLFPLLSWSTKFQVTCPVENYEFVADLYLQHDFSARISELGGLAEHTEVRQHLFLLSANGWNEVRNRLLQERLKSFSDHSVDTTRHNTLMLLCWLNDPTFSILVSDDESAATEFEQL